MSVDRKCSPLWAKKVSKAYRSGDESLNILRSVSLEVMPGEAVAIIGRSGSGKSTLLKILAGLELPTSGSVGYGHLALSACDDNTRAQWRSLHVGYVFQDFFLVPGLSAIENVMLPLILRGEKRARTRARSQLEELGLADRCRHLPEELSGGEQQRVAIARALVTKPHVIFADEPTGNLDEKTGEVVIETLFDLQKKRQASLVLVTHDHALAGRCSRRLTLRSGELIDEGG